ncbi:MAG: hypothetical protein LBG84_07865 [Treponema sp.]|jgi:hypothetical protein|nr:hypothetical protein [Treponema sp.]
MKKRAWGQYLYLAAAALRVLVFTGCAEPYFERSFLQATPLRTSYDVGGSFDPASDIAVYRWEEAGGTRPLSFAAGEFTVTLTSPLGGAVTLTSGTHNLDAGGDWGVAVSAAGLSVRSYTITVGRGPVVWPAEARVVPLKNTYDVNDSIVKAGDLAVYTRNTATGLMTPVPAADIQLAAGGLSSPAGTAALGPLPPGDPLTVTVTVSGYAVSPAPVYNVWVGSGGGPVIPALLVVPLRSVYSVGGVIDPANDLRVYRGNPTGVYSLLTHGTGMGNYKLTLGSGTEDPVTAPFTSAQVGTPVAITVTEIAAGGLTAAYTVDVMDAGVAVLSFFYADHSPGNPTPDGVLRRNVQGAYLREGTPQGKTIHSVVPINPATGQPFPGKTYPVGRADTEAVTLNLDPSSGDLSFRAAYSAGPYNGFIPIGSAAELAMITNLNGKYALTADIDLLGFAAYNPRNWTPIGDQGAPFSGVFDGGGKMISGVRIPAGGGHTGFFGAVGGGTAVVRNLIVDGGITGGGNTGGVAGKVGGSAKLENCENRASVTSNSPNTGGVAGWVTGGASLTNCRNAGAVTSTYKRESDAGMGETFPGNTGGAAGFVDGGGVLTGCSNSGPVKSGSSNTGGVVGSIELSNGAVLSYCSNSGSVTSEGSVSSPSPSESPHCFADNTGGVAGKITVPPGAAAAVNGCSNSGAVMPRNFSFPPNVYGPTLGSWNAGGVAGLVRGAVTLRNCFNYETINGASDTRVRYLGGLVGNVDGAVLSACHNLGAAHGGNGSGGVAGIVQNGGRIENCVNWGQIDCDGQWEGGIAGMVDNGTLSNCLNRGVVNSFNSGGRYVGGVAGLVQNGGIVRNCSNSGNLDTYTAETGGVAGKVEDGTLVNCSNTGLVLFAVGSDKGGVAGIVGNGGTLRDCSNSGEVRRDTVPYGTAYNAGGVAGRVEGGVLRDCSNSGDVTFAGNGDYVGGVAGRLVTGTIDNCHNTGTYTGAPNTGGVCGMNDGGTVTNSTST